MSIEPFKWGDEAADEKDAITIRERNGDDPRNSNRQYQWVLATADAQHARIQRHGVIRLNPGYDTSDPFVDDSAEELTAGVPMLMRKSGDVVCYLGTTGASSSSARISNPTTWKESVVPLELLSALPLRPPKCGDLCVAFGCTSPSA